MAKTGAGSFLIRQARLLLPGGASEGDCLVRDGRIAALGTVTAGDLPVVEAGGRFLSPGFLDLHVHGGAGADFSDGDREGTQAIVRFHAEHGTTGLLASIVPGPTKQMRQAMAAVVGIPGILGIHLEGPFLAPDKCGALDPQGFLLPGRAAFHDLVRGFEGHVKVVTFAPELPGADDVLEEALRIGAVPAIGHTSATYEQAQTALRQGARHFTHLGNAMSRLHHREPGAVGAALASQATLELIADGIHVHPAVIRLLVEFLRGRGGLDRLCLVSDATAAAGLPAGTYHLGSREVRLQEGAVQLADGTLAGSTLTLDQAVRNAIRFSDLPLAEALSLVTANPARLLEIGGERGILAVGAKADLVFLDPDLSVWATIRGGEVAFRRE